MAQRKKRGAARKPILKRGRAPKRAARTRVGKRTAAKTVSKKRATKTRAKRTVTEKAPAKAPEPRPQASRLRSFGGTMELSSAAVAYRLWFLARCVVLAPKLYLHTALLAA